MATSIQQIVIGLICVVAAFAFGTYINQNPSLGTPNPMEVSNDAPSSDFEFAKKKLEDIPALRHRVASINSLNELPQIRTDNFDVADVQLPSPNDLDPRLNQREDQPKQQQAAQRQPIAPPDFTSLMVQSPATTNSNSESAQDDLAGEPKSGMPTIANPFASKIRNIAKSFQDEPQQPLAPPDFSAGTQPDQFPKQSPPAADPSGTLNSGSPANSPFNTDTPSLARVDAGPEQPAIKTDVAHGSAMSNDLPPSSLASRSEKSTNVLNMTPATTTAERSTPSQAAQWGPKSNAVDAPQIATTPSHSPVSVVEPNWNSPATGPSAIEPRKTSKIPFGLTPAAKVKLVRVSREASQKIGLETTKFAEHVVMQGETLQSISTRYLGKPDYYLDIYLANRQRLANPVQVPPGMVLKVPLYQRP